jgi:colanic acid/amylovoran biosynthesis glycosyltransferase
MDMPFDTERRSPPPVPAEDVPPVLYVIPATAGTDGEDGGIAEEMAALRALGRPAVPFRLGPPPAGRAGREALRAAAGNPLGLARAARLAVAQRAMAASDALRLGARVAAAARQHNCGRIHAAAADAAATAALLGGRLAGLSVSIAGRGGEVYAGAEDLALKLRAADLVLAACTQMAEDFRTMAPRSRVRAVECGIDAELFRPAPGVVRNGRLLCLAPLLPRSGIGTLLAALAALPPEGRPVVDVIGAGPLMDPLRAEALERGVSDQVRFLGRRGARWVAAEGVRYLGLVAPNVVAPDGDRDPAPPAVLQAMAMELPVVATSLMAMREVVQPDCGHLVPPGEALPLARAIAWLAALPEDARRRFGRAGRERVLAGHTLSHRAARLAQALS